MACKHNPRVASVFYTTVQVISLYVFQTRSPRHTTKKKRCMHFSFIKSPSFPKIRPSQMLNFFSKLSVLVRLSFSKEKLENIVRRNLLFFFALLLSLVSKLYNSQIASQHFLSAYFLSLLISVPLKLRVLS
ncbi:hypothetical protein TRVL_04432 [Trypanosoma vivax]|nr:hypothetical protein TRVL_04432 [Trypanosoma vivax]